MACSIEKQKQLIEAAKIEYRRLADLKKQGYEEDIENGIEDIAEAMSNMHAIILKKPEKIKYKKSVDEMQVNALNNNKPKDGNKPITVVSGSVDQDGKIEYKVTYPGSTKQYTLPAARISADQVSPTTVETYGFTEAYTERSKIANKYVGDMAVMMYDDAGKWLSPKLREFHNKRMREHGIYEKAYKTIRDGAADIELINKVKHTLFLTGDNSRAQTAKLTTAVEEITRWANTTLTEEMPVWDRKLLRAIKDEKEQRILTEVYGLSGYGAIYHYTVDGKRVSEWLNAGHTIPEILKKMGPIDEKVDKKAEQLMNRLVNQQVQETQVVNAGFDTQVEVLTVLKTMQANKGAGYAMHKKMRTEHKELHAKLEELALTAYVLNKSVNQGIKEMHVGRPSSRSYTDYDGHGLLDLYSNTHEMKVLTKEEIADPIYKEGYWNPWKVLRPATDKAPGIVYRKSQEVFKEGLGVTTDRINNGLYVDPDYAKARVAEDKDWLVKNNIQEYTTPFGTKKYRMILRRKETVLAEGMNNVMQSLYRSNIHNIELSKTHKLQDMITEEFTENGTTQARLELLNEKIKRNNRLPRAEREEIKPYLNSKFSLDEIKEIAPLVAKEYIIARGVTTYGGLDGKIKYVRSGLSDMMIGFSSGSIIKDSWPWLQDIERKYKQLVVLKKLKMVVASPTKLLSDVISNAAILMALDVDAVEGGKDMKEAYTSWMETSAMESERVKLEMELVVAEASGDKAAIARITKRQAQIKKDFDSHIFRDAYEQGFVQSMATSMMVKEYDTISGLQHTIDEVVKKLTTNSKNEPNAVHNAITTWMHWGYGLDNILEFGANQAKKMNTSVADEIMAMAERLRTKKALGNEDVAGYISEVLAGPESEVVRQGSRVMQMGDLAARWALYKHTLKEELEKEIGRKVTVEDVNQLLINKFPLEKPKIAKIKETAGMRALDTFVDYRLNIPSEMDTASTLGVLWFPSYWLRNAVVIPQLIASRPLNSMVTMALSAFTGMDTVYASHPLWKFVNGNLIHAGMDVTTADTIIVGL